MVRALGYTVGKERGGKVAKSKSDDSQGEGTQVKRGQQCKGPGAGDCGGGVSQHQSCWQNSEERGVGESEGGKEEPCAGGHPP